MVLNVSSSASANATPVTSGLPPSVGAVAAVIPVSVQGAGVRHSVNPQRQCSLHYIAANRATRQRRQIELDERFLYGGAGRGTLNSQ